MHAKEGSVFQLVCPGPKCNASIPPHLLKRLLNEEELERGDRLALKKALDSMSDVVYCPRCEIGCLEDESNNAQ
jgi:E3 ubiquitin-protein ligase RNF14